MKSYKTQTSCVHLPILLKAMRVTWWYCLIARCLSDCCVNSEHDETILKVSPTCMPPKEQLLHNLRNEQQRNVAHARMPKVYSILNSKWHHTSGDDHWQSILNVLKLSQYDFINKSSALWSEFLFLLLSKLSQAAASIDNRVPTPASVAELSSQQALPDMSSTEAKPQVKEEEDDGDFGKKQTDVKMEVCSQFYKIIL